MDHNYIPDKLPCGKEVNLTWNTSKKMECCRTICSRKSNGEIEECYSIGGRIIGSGRFR